MSLRLSPITVTAARKLVRSWHRNLPDIQGGLFATSVIETGGLRVGVAIAGNPARVWQDQAKLVISRCATTGHDNACSMLYGALARAAKALGYIEVWTYTLPELMAWVREEAGPYQRRRMVAPLAHTQRCKTSRAETQMAEEIRMTSPTLLPDTGARKR